MMVMALSYLWYLLPWEFSPTVFGGCALAGALYARGLINLRRSGRPVGLWKSTAFFLGVALTYAVLQTYVEFLSQHMFWIHRVQHMILHHVGPVLLVLSAPGPVLRAGLPAWIHEHRPIPPWMRRPAEAALRITQQRIVAPALFVGLIYFWLMPSIHFTAMLDARRYRLMNWSMLLDGILFWWLMLAPPPDRGRVVAEISYPVRLIVLAAVAVPQIMIGAYISLHSTPLYDVYAVCGRAWAISPMLDQQLGGLFTWVPGVMMSMLGILLILHRMVRDGRPSLCTAARAPPSAIRA